MTPQLLGYIMFVASITPIIPIGVIIFHRNNSPKYILRILGIMLVFNLCIEAFSYVSLTLWDNNEISMIIFSIGFGVLIIELYRNELSHVWAKSTWRLILFLYILYNICYNICKWQFNILLVDPYLVLSILIIGLSIYYFYLVFTELEIASITQHYFFWINSAMLVFFGSTIFMTLFEEFIVGLHKDLFIVVWPIQLFATVLFNLIIARGIWVTKRI